MTNERGKILVNMIQTPDGTILVSHHRHDYVTYIDTKSGEEYMVDGGQEYLRRNKCKVPYLEKTLYEDDPFELVREYWTWGTRGKDGKEPLRWVTLKDITDEHLTALIDYVLDRGAAGSLAFKLFCMETAFRKGGFDHGKETT